MVFKSFGCEVIEKVKHSYLLVSCTVGSRLGLPALPHSLPPSPPPKALSLVLHLCSANALPLATAQPQHGFYTGRLSAWFSLPLQCATPADKRPAFVRNMQLSPQVALALTKVLKEGTWDQPPKAYYF